MVNFCFEFQNCYLGYFRHIFSTVWDPRAPCHAQFRGILPLKAEVAENSHGLSIWQGSQHFAGDLGEGPSPGLERIHFGVLKGPGVRAPDSSLSHPKVPESRTRSVFSQCS